MGVRLRDRKPESRMAAVMATANSRNRRPRMPSMKRMGMKTAAREIVIDRTVKPISRLPRRAASRAPSPASRRRMMFSSTTMASSTTKPMDRVRAMSDRVLRL